jgi:hypothetical protein
MTKILELERRYTLSSLVSHSHYFGFSGLLRVKYQGGLLAEALLDALHFRILKSAVL